MADYNGFKTEWAGKRVADPTLAGELPPSQWYQCVSLIKQYLREDYGMEAGYWGDAINYWNNTNPALLGKFYRVEGSEAQQGDIVVKRPNHIGIATGNIDATNVEILEQNGSTGGGTGLGNDAIRTRYIARSSIAGILRPYVVAPPALPAEVHPYTIEAITPKQIRINKDTHRWGMTYDNFTAIANNPIAPIAAGTIIGVTAICRHNIGYNYYLTDANDPSGYNVLDCDDYVAPTPPPPDPLPAPLPPSAPVPIPSPTAPYQIIKTILAFASSNDAANHINAKGTVSPGSYLVFNRRTVAATGLEVLNVTKIGGQAGSWINPEDNVPDPEPVVIPSTPIPPVEIIPTPVVPATPIPAPIPRDDTWKATYVSFDPIHRTPRVYKALSNLVIRDISGARGTTIYVKAGDKLHVFGTFTKDNTQYGRLKIRVDTEFRYYYAARITDMKRLATADLTPLVKVMDYFNLNRAKVERYEDDVINFMEMKPWFKKKNKGVKK